MEFREWVENENTAIPDIFDAILDRLLTSSHKIDESVGALDFLVEFVLEESSSPWGKERWLDSNPKINKTRGVSSFRRGEKTVSFEPYIINLLPAKQSGINLCICATAACAATCLHSAGAVQYLTNKTIGRLRKTWFIALDRDKAFAQIAHQISVKKKKIDEFNAKNEKEYKQLIVRLNGTSDLIWRVMKSKNGQNIFEMFPDVVFYDYSKHFSEMKHFIRGEVIDDEGNRLGKFPPNYHLTLSYGGPGGNMASYNQTLLSGENVAVPFGPGKTASLDYMEFPSDIKKLFSKFYYPDHIKTKKEREEYRNTVIEKIKQEGSYVTPAELSPFAGQTLLPGLFMCHEVIDGDDHDARFLDDHLHPHVNLPNDPSRPEPELEADFSRRKMKRHGLVIGLTAKGDLSFSAYKGPNGWDLDHSKFMVGPADSEMNNTCKPMLNDPSREHFLRKKTEVYKKIARTIMIIRNYDARHVNAHDGEEGKQSRTHVKKNSSSKPVQTYMTAKGRATQEMNELIKIIQIVMNGETPDTNVGKLKQAAKQAAKLRAYLLKPDIMEILNNDDFKKKAREFGIDVNFESLAKLADRRIKHDPQAPKPTLMPSSMLRILGQPELQGPKNPEQNN